MTEVKEISMRDFTTQEEDVYEKGGPGNDFAKTPSNCKSRHSQVMTSLWINIKIMWNIILFVLVIGALSFSIYAILDKTQAVSDPCSCMTTVDTPTNQVPSSSDDITADRVQELNNTISELKELLNQIYTSVEDRYNALNASILTAVQSLQAVMPSNELDLYAGCVVDRSECVLVHTDVGSMLPGRISCDTPTYDLSVERFTNTDMYCHIDNTAGESNPITSTLNIFGGEVSCLCSLVALATPTADVTCKLAIRRCPDTIYLNTTNTL